MRVLVADDDTVFLDLMSAILQEKGYSNIYKTSSYRAVLAQLDDRKSEPIELMFCDCYMPDMDVMGFLNGLEKRNYTGQIVLMTGADHETLNSREMFAQRKNLNIMGAVQKSQLKNGINAMLDKFNEISSAKDAT